MRELVSADRYISNFCDTFVSSIRLTYIGNCAMTVDNDE